MSAITMQPSTSGVGLEVGSFLKALEAQVAECEWAAGQRVVLGNGDVISSYHEKQPKLMNIFGQTIERPDVHVCKLETRLGDELKFYDDGSMSITSGSGKALHMLKGSENATFGNATFYMNDFFLSRENGVTELWYPNGPKIRFDRTGLLLTTGS